MITKDWDSIFGLLNAMKSEFKEILPYKFIRSVWCRS